MKTRLSHSSSVTFKECATKYKYQYIDRLRTTEIFSPLIWGAAIDKGLEAMLKKEDWKKKFIETWSTQKVLGKLTELEQNTLIRYLPSDYNLSLLKSDDYDYIEAETGLKDLELYQILDTISNEDFNRLHEQDKRLLNMVTWLCLKNKGFLMLQTAENEIMPQITEVISVQEQIELANEEGDIITGFVDLIAKVKGYGDIPIILDFKTSSKKYKTDSVQNSAQLSTYVSALINKYETRKAGFIVLNKKIADEVIEKTCTTCGHSGLGRAHRSCDALIDKKRCNGEWSIKTQPKVNTQFIVEDIPISTETNVLQDFHEINKLIKAGIFEKNLDSCKKFYGNKIVTCPYFNKCFKGSDEGLVKVD